MKIGIYAVGRLRTGPEKSLIDTYMGRTEAAGRALGITTTGITEVEEKRRLEGDALKAAEAGLLRNAIPRGAKTILLDERGRMESSEAFASRLGQWRDTGVSDLAFVIGGADGHDAEFRAGADHLLAFGPMTWPHMLVRVLLSEQIYRSISILSGHPYHRA